MVAATQTTQNASLRFSAMDGGVWDKATTTTNAVERLNGECKTAQPVALQHAVTDVY